MKNTFKHICFSLAALLLILNACSDEIPTREESYVPDANAIQAFFADDLESDYKVAPEATELKLTIKRIKSNEASTVMLHYVDTANVFTTPESVTFKAGETEAEITVGFSNLNFFKKYYLDIELDQSATNPYLDNDGTTSFRLYVTQTDWTKFSTGDYSSWWTESTFDHDLQYSEILKRYRFQSLLVEGYHFEFTWDGESKVTPYPEKIETGVVHPTYGMVSATTEAASYNAAEKKFVFTRKWTVSAGSFGTGDDTYIMD